MTKPVTIPNTFATATTAIPLSQLDSDFSTVATALNDANTYSNYAADTGVANAYVVTLTGVSTTYSAGLRIQFKAGNANTGASTLNVNGGGTKNITFQDASALSSGTIAANAIVDVMYDGTQFLLMNDPAGTVGTGDVVGPAGATANAVVRFDSTTGKLVKNSVVTIADSTGDVAGVGALTATGNVSFDGGTFVFNESGADKDFRIEGDTEPNLFFTDASTDRVGIGTSSPAYKLDVIGSSRIQSSSGYNFLFQTSATTARINYLNDAFSANISAAYRATDFSWQKGDGSEILKLDSSGNLGLGVTPSAWTGNTKAVQVKSAALWNDDYAGKISFGYNTYQDTDTTYKYIASIPAGRYDIAQNIHRWYNAPSGTAGNAISFTQAMTLDASGNLLVGKTSSTGVGSQNIEVSNSSSSTVAIKGGSNEWSMLVSSSSDSLRFYEDSTERARITSGGDLLVGDTGSIVGTGKFRVLQTSNDYNSRFQCNSGTTPQGLSIYYSGASPNGTGSPFIYCEDSTALRMSVRSNGGIANYSANDVNLSDRREKTNFAPAKSYLDTICAIPVQTFNYIDQSEDDPGLTLGVVAQDVQAVAPELVMESNWGTKEDPKMRLSIYQTDLQYALMKCIQELKADLDATKAELAALKGTQP